MAVINFANEVLADGPIGFWRLGEPLGSMTAADSSVNLITGALNGHNGTCSPSGIKFGQPGFHGGDTAALFTGLTGRIVVPDSVDLNPAYITMEAKVSWSGWSDEAINSIGKLGSWDQRILEKSSFEGTAQYGLMISRNSPVTGPGIVQGGDPFEKARKLRSRKRSRGRERGRGPCSGHLRWEIHPNLCQRREEKRDGLGSEQRSGVGAGVR